MKLGGRSQRRRIAWTWSITYTFASGAVSLGTWAYAGLFLSPEPPALLDRMTLSLSRDDALHRRLPPGHFAPHAVGGRGVVLVPRSEVAREIAWHGERALAFVLVMAMPGFWLNQAVWQSLRSRPRRVLGARVYGHKILALNLAILAAAPTVACAQCYVARAPFFAP